MESYRCQSESAELGFKRSKLLHNRKPKFETSNSGMFVCSLSDFLERLSPFSPHARWIDNAYDRLKEKKLLGTPANGNFPVKADPVREVLNEPDDMTAVKREAYFDTTPEHTDKSAIEHLANIVEALRNCADPHNERNSNMYRYKDSPDREVTVEMDFDFKVDGVIANPGTYKGGSKAIPLASGQTAVVMGFTKGDTPEKIYKKRQRLVSATNHIMNDDPRRNWTYGITIESTNMSLWYFSRSYSMKSASFDFTKDFKTFIHVFLSFLYATEEELGYDPSIFRRYHDNKWCYIYKLETTMGTKYYRTIKPLYNSRKSRVWKVIEVTSPKDLAPILGGHEAALKDCWVDEGSLSEKEIQTEIFDRLKAVKETDYSWAPIGLQRKLKIGITCPEAYFVKVIWDWKLGVNKEKPECKHDPFLPSPRTSNTPTPLSAGQISSVERGYKVKQHYRVVYADVGESLAYATSLSDAVRAFEDIFVALALLFLAGWVHRDVSEGNIILVRDEHGVRAKLNDLEYARPFNLEDGEHSTDPKTGTPYFMPLEIHRGKPLYHIPKDGYMPLHLRGIILHMIWNLWWIIVWIVLKRVKGVPWLNKMIFTVFDFPHPDREDFFMMDDLLEAHLQNLIVDTLCECKTHIFLTIYNHSLCEFYEKGKRQEATSYQSIYDDVWEAMVIFIANMSNIHMELEDPNTRVPPRLVSFPDSQGLDLGKRTRSGDNDSPGSERMAEDNSSRKRQKLGEDAFDDIFEEETAEEDTIQDMAGITREDSKR
ncbi:hypothetical protein AGABI2DRAFT_117365 [Agaricus bisporus var. bisporus H97]|uniref:hypothetical protein n=1 Tax=Agaricus bisporus var. bisporus (strain H97 / ATCC MYA-4626 / FGSC 10389) TaxID=936046 RepID=UPI00029F6C04|nr:hypothetical protein AGABI2DRAFT_117365 [Agaricus bisporus var. bisporus H97]EKV48551.1 hypothetical protein AGABI2DRAFT_117365 [Agaricus bisporus var. bisporus H97]